MSPLYDSIGRHYDTTRRADAEIARRLMHHLQLPPGAPVLDAACGTGNYTVALSTAGLRMSGVDISSSMLDAARRKSHSVEWALADVSCLPYQQGTYQGVTCILAIHHFDDIFRAFAEMYRVLNDGRLVIFTASPEQMKSYWLNAYFPTPMTASISQMPSLDSVIRTLRQVGFSFVGVESFLVEPNLQDFFLYSGKLEPEMYLDPAVRAGISTFSSLASKDEIESGCRKLGEDIDSGKIQDVIRQYTSVMGDYMFIVAEK